MAGLARDGSDSIDVFDLRFAFKIEGGDARADGVDDFLVGFPDAGVDDLGRVRAGFRAR